MASMKQRQHTPEGATLRRNNPPAQQPSQEHEELMQGRSFPTKLTRKNHFTKTKHAYPDQSYFARTGASSAGEDLENVVVDGS